MQPAQAPKLQLTVVSQEKQLLSEAVDSIIAMTTEGEITVLPRHIPLLTMLDTGELEYTVGTKRYSMVVSKGFLTVAPNNSVTVIVDSAVLARDINESKAQEAIKKAQETVALSQNARELLMAEAALRKAMLELRIAQKTKATA